MSSRWVVNASPLIEEVGSFERARIEGEVAVTPELRSWDLEAGESQVLALASLVPGSRAVLDGRRCAQALGLPVIGTLGVVLRAKNKGEIPAARPLIEHLRRVELYASEPLIEGALGILRSDEDSVGRPGGGRGV